LYGYKYSIFFLLYFTVKWVQITHQFWEYKYCNWCYTHCIVENGSKVVNFARIQLLYLWLHVHWLYAKWVTWLTVQCENTTIIKSYDHVVCWNTSVVLYRSSEYKYCNFRYITSTLHVTFPHCILLRIQVLLYDIC